MDTLPWKQTPITVGGGSSMRFACASHSLFPDFRASVRIRSLSASEPRSAMRRSSHIHCSWGVGAAPSWSSSIFSV